MTVAPMISTAAPRFLRPLASLLAAALALASTALLYLLAAVPEVENFVHVRLVLGPDGFMQGSLAITLAWLAGPTAAAACAWVLAFRAARGERWAGSWMGLATYSVSLLLASFVPDLSRAISGQASLGQSLFEGLVGAPIMAIFAAAVLGPLLVACIAAGSVWAWIIRHVVVLPAEPHMKPRPFDYAGITVLTITILSLLGSLLLTLVSSIAVFPDGMD